MSIQMTTNNSNDTAPPGLLAAFALMAMLFLGVFLGICFEKAFGGVSIKNTSTGHVSYWGERHER